MMSANSTSTPVFSLVELRKNNTKIPAVVNSETAEAKRSIFEGVELRRISAGRGVLPGGRSSEGKDNIIESEVLRKRRERTERENQEREEKMLKPQEKEIRDKPQVRPISNCFSKVQAHRCYLMSGC